MPRSSKPLRKWRKAARVAAPQIAHAAGGPLAGMAVRAVADALLGKPHADENALDQALSAPTAEQIARLQRAETQFIASAQQIGVDLEQIAAADRADARRRQAEMRDPWPSVLGLGIVIGFFTVLSLMVFGAFPSGAETEFSIMLGALATMTAAVVNYFFGSSAGSAKKTELMARREAD